MNLPLLRLAFPTAFGGGLVAAVLAAAGAERAALVALALAFSALTLAVALGQRALLGESRHLQAGTLAVVRRSARRTRAAVRSQQAVARRGARHTRELAERVDAAARTTSHTLAQLDRRSQQLQARTHRLGTAVDRLPSEIVNLGRFQDALVPGLVAMPGLGGWAATAPTVVFLLESVLADEADPVVLECGSGTSTVWIASALRRRGAGRVVALEHDPHYAEQSRRDLRRHGLDALASVVDAPIVERTVATGPAPWYDTTGLGDLAGVTLLFVDGPPAATGPEARRPALELLADRLADGALVVLDDTDRAEERAIVEAWTARPLDDGRRLEVVTQVSRSTVLRLVRG